MPMDLSSELKNRLNSSTHASVSNLRKSATMHDATRTKQSGEEHTAAPKHDDALSLVRNLSNLGRPPTLGAGGGGSSGSGDGGGAAGLRAAADTIASTSEGESSGGREISEIIKNSAVARRRKLNDGYLAKVKPTAKFWPYQFKPQQPPPQHEQT
ncbi:uncharacterized protein LOC118754651 [Rhagoletis pomonella]|uniref:uncharacterized protein LOC118754651 n=2 Tax=Rhagoletis pomonella TaxID=28610 RepID=UPI00178408DB|nr:uncharacterized protein LOC118754651 [Rhagoletis pomonella]